MLFIFVSLGLFFILMDYFVACARKTQKEFSQVFITKIVFMRENKDKDFKHNKKRKNTLKYHQVNTLILEKYRGRLGATIPLQQVTSTDRPLTQYWPFTLDHQYSIPIPDN